MKFNLEDGKTTEQFAPGRIKLTKRKVAQTGFKSSPKAGCFGYIKKSKACGTASIV